MMIRIGSGRHTATTGRRFAPEDAKNRFGKRTDGTVARSLGRANARFDARSFLGFSIFDSRFLFFSSFDLIRFDDDDDDDDAGDDDDDADYDRKSRAIVGGGARNDDAAGEPKG
jgi:hypothetical protein